MTLEERRNLCEKAGHQPGPPEETVRHVGAELTRHTCQRCGHTYEVRRELKVFE